MRKIIVNKYLQSKGVIRRFYLGHFNKNYVNSQKLKRHGECKNCGFCCRFVVKCPLLYQDDEGKYLCKIHNNKPSNCNIFPVNEKDIKDRNTLNPDVSCGYAFYK